MGVTDPGPGQDRLIAVERRMGDLVGRFLPHAGLMIGLAMTPVVVRGEPWVWPPILALSATAAAWAWWFTGRTPARAERPVQGPVYVVGLLALMAALAWLSPIFGFLALAGYTAAFAFLPGRWRYVGIVAASAVVSYTYLGGRLTEFTAAAWLGYGVLLVVNSTVAAVFTWYGMFTATLAGQRREIIADRDAANARLRETLEQNAALQARLLVAAREAGTVDERARMAREIHDTLAQGLTGIVAQLEAADGAPDAGPDVRRRLDTARALARESLTEARRSVEALSPARLEAAGLPAAVEEMARDWQRGSGVELTVETTGVPMRLVPELEVTLYRVAQEALANAGRHAGARRVGLTLSYMDDVVVLDVRDDGVGFDPDTVRPAGGGGGFGLPGMAQRVQRVSGAFDLESAPGDGTAVSARVPAVPAHAAGETPDAQEVPA